VTWGLVEGFTRWLLLQGYSVSSVNVRLSTVKTYSRLAAQAGSIPSEEYAMIRLVQGYSRREARRVDERRLAAGVAQRVGLKKPSPTPLTAQQAAQLKIQPDTPQGRRDALLMCLLLDHGLRAGEAALLEVEDFDLPEGVFRFHRPKVDKVQTHRLSADALSAARRYLQIDALPAGKLLRASRKDGSLRQAGLSTRAISGRVEFLGAEIGVPGLSAHDCRHHWATRAARAGTPLERLQDAGGWASLAMPARYIEAAEVANEGVELE
jgi:integrase